MKKMIAWKSICKKIIAVVMMGLLVAGINGNTASAEENMLASLANELIIVNNVDDGGIVIFENIDIFVNEAKILYPEVSSAYCHLKSSLTGNIGVSVSLTGISPSIDFSGGISKEIYSPRAITVN